MLMIENCYYNLKDSQQRLIIVITNEKILSRPLRIILVLSGTVKVIYILPSLNFSEQTLVHISLAVSSKVWFKLTLFSSKRF